MDDDITCPTCEECGWFTLHRIGDRAAARCQNCHHEIPFQVIADPRRQIAAAVEAIAANYPEDAFPPNGTSRDAIGGTAMRHAYRNAARVIREFDLTPDEPAA